MNSNSKSPLYFNLSQNVNYNQSTNDPAEINVTPSVIETYNNAPFLNSSDEYFIGVMRANIPTSGVPKLIVPVLLDGGLNQNPDKLIYIFTLVFRGLGTNQNGDILTYLSENVIFESEVQGIKKPNVYPDRQDFNTVPYYYYVYDVDTMLNSFNNTIRNMWGRFVVKVQAQVGIDISTFTPPYFGFNQNTNKFTYNADYRLFSQERIYSYVPPDGDASYTIAPHCELFSDGLIEDLLQCPSYYMPKDSRNTAIGYNINLINLYKCLQDGTTTLNGDILTISAWKSALNMWNALTKIVFTIGYGISTKLEWENSQSSDGQLTVVNNQDPVRPLKSVLTDIMVNADEFGVNNNYIQFSASSISQIRLIDVTTKQDLQNFSLTVKWVDNFNNDHDLIIPTAHPLNIKLAFFPKSTNLI